MRSFSRPRHQQRIPYAAPDLQADLLAWWVPIDGTQLVDVMGGVNLNLINSLAYTADADFGNVLGGGTARQFAISIASPGEQYNLVSDFTLTAWVRWKGAETTSPTAVISKSGLDGTLRCAYALGITNARQLQFWHRPGTSYSYTTSGLYVGNDAWSFIAAALLPDGVTMRFCCDGVIADATLAVSLTSAFFGSRPLVVSGYYYADNYAFNGYIADARIYRRAKTPAELIALSDPNTRFLFSQPRTRMGLDLASGAKPWLYQQRSHLLGGM